jgi:hypothetical protein
MVKERTTCSLVEIITKLSEESAASILRVGPKHGDGSFLLNITAYPPDKVVPLRDKEAYRRSRGTVPLILNLRIRWTQILHAPAVLPLVKNPVPIVQDTGWDIRDGLDCFGEEKFVSRAGIRTADRPASSKSLYRPRCIINQKAVVLK